MNKELLKIATETLRTSRMYHPAMCSAGAPGEIFEIKYKMGIKDESLAKELAIAAHNAVVTEIITRKNISKLEELDLIF